jgi:hypothetical protein
MWMFIQRKLGFWPSSCGLAKDNKLSCAHTALILPPEEEREDCFLQIEGQFNP